MLTRSYLLHTSRQARCINEDVVGRVHIHVDFIDSSQRDGGGVCEEDGDGCTAKPTRNQLSAFEFVAIEEALHFGEHFHRKRRAEI